MGVRLKQRADGRTLKVLEGDEREEGQGWGRGVEGTKQGVHDSLIFRGIFRRGVSYGRANWNMESRWTN